MKALKDFSTNNPEYQSAKSMLLELEEKSFEEKRALLTSTR
jgi:hypothetical protein